MRLIVTRPAAQAGAWVMALQALGQDAVALPLIAISPPADPAPVRLAWQQLPQCSLAMFVSANAVAHFFAAADGQWPAGVRAGSTGPGTSAALREAGVPEALLVEPAADAAQFDSEALWARLSHEDWCGRHALVVRGEEGRDWLADTLRSRGAEVAFVAAYRRQAPQPGPDGQALLAQALAAPAAHLWLFSSSEAVGHLRTLAAAADWRSSRAVASHPRIAQAARDAGFGQVQLAAPSPAAVAALALAWPSIQSATP
jgi:uroporphyrinogen-III synthase